MDTSQPVAFLGAALSLSSAMVWATAVILFRIIGFTVSPLSLNLFKGVIGSILLFATLLIMGPLVPENFRWDHFLWMFANGAVGIALADTLFFRSLNILGATRSAIVDCLYSPFIIFFAFIILGEKLSGAATLGALLIVSGVLINSFERDSGEISRADLWKGTLFGVLAMATMGVAIVAVKPILSEYTILFSTATRMWGGTAALILFSFLRPDWRKTWDIFRPQAVWKFAIPAGILGAYVAFLLWMGGFKHAPANIAGLLTQMTSLFIVILAVVILKERLNKRKIVAIVLAFTGVVLVIS